MLSSIFKVNMNNLKANITKIDKMQYIEKPPPYDVVESPVLPVQCWLSSETNQNMVNEYRNDSLLLAGVLYFVF